MMMIPDAQLLQDYAHAKSQDAFTELVRRHLNLVYSTALRQVRSAQLAEEISQSVFADLARATDKLSPDTILTAWLYQVTRRTAIDVVRRESRRQAREHLAVEMAAMNTAANWTHIEPLLDDAMEALDETDRAAILLRYFDNKSLREVGETLGTSDDAAQKRVSRAVERLREFFSKRGVAVGVGGLVALVSTNAVQASPAGLAATITTTVFAGTTTGTAVITHLATSWITMKITTGIIIGAVASATVMYLVLHQKANRLQSQNQALIAQHKNPSPGQNTALTPDKGSHDATPQGDSDEVLRLRGQVGVLRQQTNELGQLQAQTRSARARQLSEEMKKSAGQIGITRRVWMDMSPNLVLTNINQFKKAPPGGLSADVNLDNFEIIPQPAPLDEGYPEVAVFRERTPRRTPDGKWARVYGMVDGSTIEQISADGNFEPWEKQHLMPPKNTP
jgi:RNA polymerase sigma factor (sigma-70 family)